MDTHNILEMELNSRLKLQKNERIIPIWEEPQKQQNSSRAMSLSLHEDCLTAFAAFENSTSKTRLSTTSRMTRSAQY
ncbi:hypothetical protein evm_004363 [Chilo suppressalis]|nr:hypothetical protein evm_004363 [Chilo suppressalis]